MFVVLVGEEDDGHDEGFGLLLVRRNMKLANSCVKTHPLSTVVTAAGDNVLFIVISASAESKAVRVKDGAAGGCSRSGGSEACGWRWPGYDDDGRPGNGAIDERRVTSR